MTHQAECLHIRRKKPVSDSLRHQLSETAYRWNDTTTSEMIEIIDNATLRLRLSEKGGQFDGGCAGTSRRDVHLQGPRLLAADMLFGYKTRTSHNR